MRSKSATVGIVSMLAVVFGPATSASADTIRGTEDVTGSIFTCATHTYSLSGEIRVVIHSSLDAHGLEHFTFTATTTGVTAVDEEGSQYSVVGSQWFGSNDTPNGGVGSFTFHLRMVRPAAGSADSVSIAFHVGPSGEVDHDASSCTD
jgi:hypothetical protein